MLKAIREGAEKSLAGRRNTPDGGFTRRLAGRLLTGIALAACLVAAQAGPLLAETEITDQVTVSFADGKRAVKLTDGKTGTKYTLSGGETIRIALDEAAEEEITGLYLIWDRPPGQWELTSQANAAAETAIWGRNGFIHEYVNHSPASREIEIKTAEEGAVLCEVYVFAADENPGQLPDWVQVWQPPDEMADMLLLPTHADDEHLFFGGAMPYYAGELGMKVQVAYLTNHWAEPYRPHELLNGLWTVGVTVYPVIGPFTDYYADSLKQAQRVYDEDEVTAFQVELLRRFKPLVVIGHDINGEYGHGVHMLNAHTLQKALELSADPGCYPASAEAYGLWDVPKTYLHLYAENPILIEWDIPLERFGGRTGYEMAIEGFACHASQQKYFSVRKKGVHDCRAFGLYRSDRGPDLRGDDFMEGLTPRPDPGQSYADSFRLPELGPADYQERYGLTGIGLYFTAPAAEPAALG